MGPEDEAEQEGSPLLEPQQEQPNLRHQAFIAEDDQQWTTEDEEDSDDNRPLINNNLSSTNNGHQSASTYTANLRWTFDKPVATSFLDSDDELEGSVMSGKVPEKEEREEL